MNPTLTRLGAARGMSTHRTGARLSSTSTSPTKRATNSVFGSTRCRRLPPYRHRELRLQRFARVEPALVARGVAGDAGSVDLTASDRLDHDAAFHHEAHPLEEGRVGEWIARDGDDVGEEPRSDGADSIAPAKQIRRIAGRSEDRLHRRHAPRD